jgi:glycosyltransferase involved in cell wall biosynthesis
MPDVYRSADAFLHMSLGESFGNVYVEALASGASIVAHDGPVSRWILEGHALLVDTREEAALVRALSRALREGKQRAEERAAFARGRYTWRTVAARYLDFLRDVVQRAA